MLIAEHRVEVTPTLLEHIDKNPTHNPLTITTREIKEVGGQEVEVTVEEELTPQDLYPRHSAEGAQRLIDGS